MEKEEVLVRVISWLRRAWIVYTVLVTLALCVTLYLIGRRADNDGVENLAAVMVTNWQITERIRWIEKTNWVLAASNVELGKAITRADDILRSDTLGDAIKQFYKQ